MLLGPAGTPLASPQNIGISLWNVEQGGTATPNQKCITPYRAAKRLCEQACNASLTAHMCTAFEAIRFYELGGDFPHGWIKSGAGVYTAYPGGGAAYSDDCHGWSSPEDSRRGELNDKV